MERESFPGRNPSPARNPGREVSDLFDKQLWVEPIGNLIIARLRGAPTTELFEECQRRVVLLAQETGLTRAIYDALEMEAPSVDMALAQRSIADREEIGAFRRAIVVPNSRLAYLARLAFGEGDYRVFYSDMTAAINWLSE